MPASSFQQQKLRVCEVCSAYLGLHDNDRRLADHFGGKLHLGFIQIREKLDQLKVRPSLSGSNVMASILKFWSSQKGWRRTDICSIIVDGADYFAQKAVVDKQEKRNQERLKRREEREKEERMRKRWVQTPEILLPSLVWIFTVKYLDVSFM